MEVSCISPRTEAAEKLENFILVNRLSANCRIPSERSLCEMWGINRATLRFAVDMLVQQGCLYRKKGEGTYVAEPKHIRNLRGVNALAAEIRQQGIPLTTKILSIRTIIANKQISKNLHVPLGQKVYECIRVRSVGAVPSILETTYIDCAQCPNFEQYYNDKASMYSIFINIYKKNIVNGEEKISVTYTSDEEAILLEVPKGTPIFFTTGVTIMDDGEPLEYYKALFRADRFKFISTISKQNQKVN